MKTLYWRPLGIKNIRCVKQVGQGILLANGIEIDAVAIQISPAHPYIIIPDLDIILSRIHIAVIVESIAL